MEFLFGDGQYGLRFLFAFIVVLGLIGLTAWLVRRFGAGRLGAAATRGRQPRLAVIDAAQVDGRRRLILIRRDNVEHLLMIGGPTDVVIEPNIVRAAAAAREAVPRSPAATDTLPRAMPLGEGAWPLQPEPMPAPPPRPHRAPPPQVAEETMQWQIEPEAPPPPAPPPRQSRAIDPLAGLAAELSRNPPPQPDPAIPPPRPVRERAPAREREAAREQQEPPRERITARAQQQPAAPVEAPFASSADQNLAEMAQRLEAALRRPGAKAEARTAEPKPAPQPEPPPQVEAVHEEPAPAPVATEPRQEPRPEPRPAPSEPKPAREGKPAQGKSLYDSLEQEMASLLGRPNSKS